MTRAILNLAALAATILINFLANALPLNGKTTGEISDSFAVFLSRPAMPFPSGA